MMTGKKNGAAPTGRAQGGYAPYARVRTTVFAANDGDGAAEWPAAERAADAGAQSALRPVTAAEVEEIVRRVLSETTVYVLESDITEAQQAVKGVVAQTYF